MHGPKELTSKWLMMICWCAMKTDSWCNIDSGKTSLWSWNKNLVYFGTKFYFKRVFFSNSLGRKVHVPANFSRNFSGVILRSEICWDGISLRIPEKKGGEPPFLAQFSKWRLNTWYGQTNFFSTGDKSKHFISKSLLGGNLQL